MLKRPITQDEIIAARYVPKNAVPLHEDGIGTVYVYPSARTKGAYAAIAYREKAHLSDFHYTFKTDAQLDAHVTAWFDGIRKHKALVIERRTKEFAGHVYKVGDIVTNSWGYDQTNVDWYRVTRTTKNYVWLKPVSSTMDLDDGCGPMSGQCGLKLDENLQPIDGDGPEAKHRASGEYVTMRHGCGSKYTGGTKYESWYA